MNAAGITHRMVHALRVKQNGRDSMCSFSKPYFLDRRKGGQSTYDQVSDDDNIRQYARNNICITCSIFKGIILSVFPPLNLLRMIPLKIAIEMYEFS